MPARSAHQAPFRLWAPARFRALVSVVAAAAAGLTPAAAVLLPATPAYADAGDIIIEADIEDAEAGTFTFEIRRVGPTTTPFTLTYTTAAVPGAAHPATAGEDFTAISGSTTFTASSRDSIKRITVTGLTDTKDENDEVFGLSLTNVTDPLNNLAIGTLSDDDLPPTYSFSANEAVDESVGTVTTTATLGSLSDFPITIPWETANGSAVTPGDYTSGSGTLAFAPGESTKNITTAVTDDVLDESNETFTVAATGSPTGVTTSVASRTVTINDNDATPAVSIANATSVREGDTLNFPVSLDAVSGQAVTVVADTANGTASAASADYTAVTAQTVTIPAGQTSVNLPVTTLSDQVSELSPEDLTVTLSSPANATLGTSSATGSIVDSVATITPTTVVSEDNSGSHNQVFDVTLSAAAQAPIEIGYSVGGGTATDGADYDAVSGTLTYAAGDTVEQITVPIRGDTLYEGNEDFDITLTNAGGEVTGGLGATAITLPDDDAAPTVASVSAVSVAEGSGNHTETFTATLSNPSKEAVTLDVTAVDGSAVDAGAGEGSDDFNIIDTSVEVPAGATTVPIQVQVNGEAVYEGNETANIVATVAGGETGATVGSNASGTLTLTNDDVVPVVTVGSTNAGEGTAAHPVTASIVGTAQASLPFTVAVTDGTAQPADYDAGNVSLSGNITPGASSLNLGTIELLDDTVDDAANAVDVTFTAAGLASSTGTVTINDASDDTAPNVVGTASVPVNESAGLVNVPVTLDFAAAGSVATSTENPISVDYSTVAGDAKATLDYTAVSNSTVTFAPGQTSKNAAVTLTDDNYFEVPEDFTVVLSNPVGAAALQADTATVTVSDNDGSPPLFTVAQTGTATEAGTATFTVTMAAPAAVNTVFDITASGLTAESDDYTDPAGSTVTVPKDQTTATFTVQTATDTVHEGSETATITVTPVSGVSVDPGAVGATLTITDDDPVPTLVLTTSDHNESDGAFNITATSTGVAEADMEYTVTVAGYGADPAEGGDFTGTSATVTRSGGTPAGTSTTLIAVTPVGDTIDENTETIRASVNNDTLGTPDAQETYGITDAATNLSPKFEFGAPVTVAENAGPAVVPVTKTWTGVGGDAVSTEKTITVQYDTVDGTATASNDFTALSGQTLSFAGGETSKDISVVLTDDSVYELNQDFTVRLSSPSGDATVPSPDQTVTVTDDDNTARPTFSVVPVDTDTVAEGDSIDYQVVLSAAAVSDTTFDVSLSGGTAQTGGMNPGQNDYTAPAGTVTITAGLTEGTISIPVAADNVYEGAETRVLNVALAGGESDVTGSTATPTINITDGDSIPTIALNGGTAAEGGSVSVEATPTGVAQNTMTYTLTVAGDATNSADPAESGDYNHALTTVTVPGGSTSGVAVPWGSISLTGDTIDENTETFKITARNDTYTTTPDVSGLYTGTDDAADTAPAVTFGSGIPVAEAGTDVTVPVTLDFSGSSAQTTEKTVTATYTTQPGTATAGVDYTTTTDTVSFTPGDNAASFMVPITSDEVYETDETFTVALSNPSDATLGTSTNTVTITDDDSGAIPSYTVSQAVTVTENGGLAAEFTVTLGSAAAEAIDFDATITDGETTDGGTANLGKDDYTAPGADFQIAKDATEATVSIPITNDTAYEGTETFSLQIALDSGENRATGGPVTRTVTITDDENVPTLTLAGAAAAENAAVDVVATTDGLAERAMDYSLTLAGDSANSANPAESADFTDSGLTAQVAAGTASGSTVTLRSVPLLADTVDEPAETFKVTATNDTYTTTPTVSGLYTITDDAQDTEPAVTFGSAVTVAEGGTNATVPVTLDFTGSQATTTEWPVTAQYATSSGTASTGTDFTAATGTVSFTPGDNASSFTVPIESDALYETDETFTVNLSSPANATLGTASNTVEITDDDSSVIPGFTVTPAVPATEGDGATAEFTVTLGSPAAETIDFDATIVDGGTTDAGTADLGKDDYTAPPVNFTIAKDATTATVTVPITNDPAYEGTETFDLEVSLDPGETRAIGAPTTGTATIADDESVPTLTMVTAQGAENASVGVTATVDGVAERDMVYSLSLAGDAAGGNAAEAPDFTNSPSPTTVPGGTADGSTVNLGSIPLLADKVDEPVETIKATAANTTYPSTPAASGLYTITDDAADKPPSVSLGAANVAEDAGNAAVPVTLTFLPGNDATSSEQAVSITPQALPGTAGIDDYGQPATQSIAAGAATGSITVPILDDTTPESEETFQVRAASVGPAGATTGTDTAVVTITDDDRNAVKPSFSVDAVPVSEGAGSATFTVTLSEAARADVDLTVSSDDGTAKEAAGGVGGDDYDRPSGTLRIGSGSRTGTFTVPVKQDSVFENDETARFTVALATGETDATGPAKDATLTITNDDTRPALALSPSASGTEGEVTFLTGSIDGITQVDVNYGSLEVSGTTSGDPAETADYKLLGGGVVVPGGTTAGIRVDVASIDLLGDTVDEPVETFDLALGAARATVRINDDPADAPPTVSVSDESIRENEQSVDVRVALDFAAGTTGTERKISVPWRTVAGTAEAGGDFTNSSGTATFDPGTDSVTVNVPLVGDSVREGDQRFVVRLETPAPNDVKVEKADGTVTIEDDDTAVRPTLTIASAIVTGEQRVRLSGTAAPGTDVELLTAANYSGSGGYRVVLTTETGDDGKFSFNPNFTQGYRLYVRASGLVSPVRTVQVRQEPAIRTVSNAAGAATITVTGDPDKAGQTVRVQRLVGGEWDTVATGKLTAAGTYTTTERRLRSGRSATYRAVISATPSLGILAGTSPARSVRVR
ncbi:Calx-beta domain-containing protein [Actinoplanes sp. NPDC023801]|uniref:Calx-beta domain-containing protein n=1 Tax=Actinoplanes sp. NPDC023801 TaxID=3154595 RepID=UPI0033D5E40D